MTQPYRLPRLATNPTLLLLGLLVVIGAMALFPIPATAACAVQARTTEMLDLRAGTPLVTVLVNDKPGAFILDTGAERSMVTRSAVARLDLALDEWVGTTMQGVGGIERHRNAKPRSLSLGGVALERRTRTRDTSLTVGTLPRAQIGGRVVDGLLGRDFLSLFDLALDLAERTVTLYDVKDCAGRFLPWTEPYVAVPVGNPTEAALVVPLEIDGVRLRALLDTGANRSALLAPGIVKLGAKAGTGGGQVTGAGPRTVAAGRFQFGYLRIGDEVMRDPVLIGMDVRIVPIVDMLLGTDWMMRKRVWISFSTKQLFVLAR